MFELCELEEKIGYTFRNKKLLLMATTHSSYINQSGKKNIDEYNERIEFLGDAILEHAISVELYNVKPSLTEGVMSKKRAEIVCEKSLVQVMQQLDIAKFLRVGKCELATHGNAKPALIADMFESIIGAICLDSDFDNANAICLKLLSETIQQVIHTDIYGDDYKTKLQEMVQKNGNIKIEYKLIAETGEAHNKTFTSAVYIADKKYGQGIGKTKKQSEQEAAKKGITRYEN